MKRILLVGAGHAHLVVLRSLKHAPLYGASITMVTPAALQIYSGMLPGVIAGHYHLREAQIDVAALAGYVDFVQGELASLDLKRRVAKLASGVEIEYDHASLNAGSLVDSSLTGAREHALPVKPFHEFIDKLPRSPLGKLLKKDLLQPQTQLIKTASADSNGNGKEVH